MNRVRRQLGLTQEFLKRLPVGTEEITVAVLDSGIAAHPDLRGALIRFRDFTYKRSVWPYDDYGHGTHVAGILCGDGAMLGGRYRGICKGARLLVGKVLNGRGEGAAEDMLAGMDWVLEMKEYLDVRLLNLSVGISDLKQPDKKRKLKEALRRITDSGILVVCAAGNNGPSPGSLSYLGDDWGILSVGCNDGEYFRGDPRRCETYSGRGMGNGMPRKPDMVAPGTKIWSCGVTGGKGGQMKFGYVQRSGTSMATPIVTGCMALALQVRPDLKARELIRLATGTAMDLGLPWNQQGWGMVCPRAMLEKISFLEKF